MRSGAFSSGRAPSGSQIARTRRTRRPACSTQVASLPQQITLMLCSAAKPAVARKSTRRRSRTSVLRPCDMALDVAGESTAVGGVDLALDGDGDRRRSVAMRLECRTVVYFALAYRFGVGSEYPGSTYRHDGPPEAKGSRCGFRQGMGPFVLKPPHGVGKLTLRGTLLRISCNDYGRLMRKLLLTRHFVAVKRRRISSFG